MLWGLVGIRISLRRLVLSVMSLRGAGASSMASGASLRMGSIRLGTGHRPGIENRVALGMFPTPSTLSPRRAATGGPVC